MWLFKTKKHEKTEAHNKPESAKECRKNPAQKKGVLFVLGPMEPRKHLKYNELAVNKAVTYSRNSDKMIPTHMIK